MNESRPNPDELLVRIANEERKSKRGRFRLFFGMAAGVGKTCAMLKAAHENVKEGVEVWVGFVETHKRTETQKLLQGLHVIPTKTLEYKGTVQEEMDLDAILAKKPQLVLVDELAHSNIPGSRHEKRYQDVIEILDAGIDVYSTMNVQHLESRADVVGLITAVTVRETVPDSILDLVDQIELIDITPHELIGRLKEGKIYPGRKTEQALQYFFQTGNLSALREIALRVTADKVERDMRDGGAGTTTSSASSHKLLVAISHSPFSEKLIRTARRIVEDLEMPWVAVHVDNGHVLAATDHNQLVKNMELASEMGAETLTLHGDNIADTLTDYIANNKVAQVILGRPFKHGKRARSSFFIEKLIRRNPSVDITILQHPQEEHVKSKKNTWKPTVDISSMGQAILWVLLTAAFNYGIDYYFGTFIQYRALGFVFLFLIIVLSIFLPFTAVILASVLSALIWDFAFMPPRGTFIIHSAEDMMMLIAYFFVALASGILNAQVRRNQMILKDREEKTNALYEILKSMTLVQGTKPVVDLALVKIEKLFNATCCVILKQQDKLETMSPDYGTFIPDANDKAVAAWSFNNGKMAGWSTDTLPLSRVMCVVLKSGENKLGVLLLKPNINKKLTSDQENLLISIANQIGIVLAKQKYDEDNREAKLLKESEKLHQTLLNCISHELRTPLTSIMGAATALQSQKESAVKEALTDEIVTSSERLNQVFENLLSITRLESGVVKLKTEWFDLYELIRFTLEKQKKILSDHKIIFNELTAPLYLEGDFALLEHVFSNLLINAAKYSPHNTRIFINIKNNEAMASIELSDEGPGIPDNALEHVFEKFYRIPGSSAEGLGLGLSIAKNLVELHGGKISVTGKQGLGATFTVELPYKKPPKEIGELNQ